MSREEKDKRFIKRGKRFLFVMSLLCLMNIIILIGKNPSYAFFRRTVSSKRVIEIHVASEFPSKEGKANDIVKATLGKSGGVIGVTANDTKVTQEGNSIREYRYSGLGVNNYVYFNCKDNVSEQNSNNCEIWRILGIFKDENGQEHMKIVRDKILPKSAIPNIYTINETSFYIRYNSPGSQAAYFNAHKTDSSGDDNDWSDAGIMYWLNSVGSANGYFRNLSLNAQKMIEVTKHYLGALTYDSTNKIIKDTVSKAYKYERAITGCNKNEGSNKSQSELEGNSSCRVWINHNATWMGKITFMYPSDYGYTVDSQYWKNTIIGSEEFESTAVETSWLFKGANHSVGYPEWFLSPTSISNNYIAFWNNNGRVGHSTANNDLMVRPSLYLKSDIQIIGGDGSLEQPYQLNYIPTAVETIKITFGKPGGVIGVTSLNSKVIQDGSDIREYRYSEATVDNYIYFNCNDNTIEQNENNCEIWRIIGIFKDEDGQDHLKIVRNEVLSEKKVWDSENKNDWITSNLNTYLNGNYLTSLSSKAQDMIEETKWYLGGVTLSSSGDTTKVAYTKERSGSTWTGKIALMYPSDYGFSAKNNYWSETKIYDYDGYPSATSWLYKTANQLNEWLISPFTGKSEYVSGLHVLGSIKYYNSINENSVRPSLYLKSTVQITGGEGTSTSPYELTS